MSNPSELNIDQYPNIITWDGVSLPLSYEFSPGGIADGVTVTIPIGMLNRLPRYLCDWLIPGMLREKCIHLVKGLPKGLRKNLVPVPDFVDKVLEELVPADISLNYSLAKYLSQIRGVSLTEKDFYDVNLQDFFYMIIQLFVKFV